LLAAGCGDTLSLDPVAKAADASAKQVSEHLTLSATVTSGVETATMSGSGDFRNNPNVGDLAISVTDAGKTAHMREILDGSTIYMTSDLFAGQLPDGKTWLKLDLEKAMKPLGLDFAALSSQSPTDALTRLRAAGSVTKVGPATVDGVATTHYSVILDLDRVAKLTKGLQNVSYGPVEVWVDEQGLVRRMHLTSVQGDSAGTPQAVLEMTMTLSNYGEPVTVTPPADSSTVDLTDLATQFLK